MGTYLSIDETSLSNGELYTIVTNKAAKGKTGSLIAIVKGTKASVVSEVLTKLSFSARLKVEIITLDMANSMDWIVRECFPNAKKINDRFHVQQLVSEALQTMRIKERWKAVDEESEEMETARKMGIFYHPFTYSNGDTKKQLLARSRHLLFKTQSKWTDSQKERASLLFTQFPELKEGYELSMMFRSFYEHSKTPEEAKKKLDKWYSKVKIKQFPSFSIAMRSIKSHEGWILNYFPERQTNAAAESFNAKLKGFRGLVRGVTDKKFFLFRIAKIYG